MYWNFFPTIVTLMSPWLTLTWDVLKLVFKFLVYPFLERLTLTWDVLKWRWKRLQRYTRARLTLTWDVLKYTCRISTERCYMININMRCIEILFDIRLATLMLRLTLTWDVLKFLYRIINISFYLININMRCIEIRQRLIL